MATIKVMIVFEVSSYICMYLCIDLYYFDFRIKFLSVKRMLCSTTQHINTNLPVSVEATTFAKSNISLRLYAEVLLNFTVRFVSLLWEVMKQFYIFLTQSEIYL